MSGKNKFFRQDIRRSLTGIRFWGSMGICLLILLRPLSGVLAEQILFRSLAGELSQRTEATFFQLLSIPFATSGFTPFAAAFCPLPFSDSFCEDYNSAYSRHIVIRIGSRRYARGRTLCVMLTGGLMMAAVVLITCLICAGLADQPESEETVAFMARSVWGRMDLLLLMHGRVVVGLKVMLAFLFGSLWALVGLAVSVIWTNRYITVIAPFAFYQALWLRLEGKGWNPVYLLRGDSDYIPSLGYIFLVQGTCILLCFLFCCLGIRMKVERQ